MNDELRRLLVELAKTVLRVLDTDEPRATNKRRHGVVAAINAELATIEVLPDPVLVSRPASVVVHPQRGDVVRVWSGDRYETGTVKAICRGEPRRLWVSIARGEGKRAKKVRVESDKAVVIKAAKGVA